MISHFFAIIGAYYLILLSFSACISSKYELFINVTSPRVTLAITPKFTFSNDNFLSFSIDKLKNLCYNTMILLILGVYMEIISLKPTGFSSNSFLIVSGNEAFAVDPSISETVILRELESRSLKLRGILLTHGHFDHIWKLKELREKTGVPVYVHELDAEMLTDSQKNAYSAFMYGDFSVGEADVLLRDADVLTLGDEQLTVIHTPGHTKGSVCFDTGDSLITGDTLFAEGFGRYDLYGGDLDALKTSLKMLCEMAERERKWLLAGHGEPSTLKSATQSLKYYFDF